MNEFQGVESGKGILKNDYGQDYPSAMKTALKKRALKSKEKHLGLEEDDIKEEKEDQE